jgi:flagellar P-ring protein FlgI
MNSFKKRKSYMYRSIVNKVKILGAFLAIFLWTTSVYAARLKDIADIEGVRGNQLIGYGIVIGLNGTGDGNGVEFTTKSLSNLLEKMGLRVNPKDVRVKNVASVLVTATLPPFVRPGSKIDVTLSSLGDAKSLLGGTLLFTPLKGADGNVYAVAQGGVVVGGYTVETGAGDSQQKNHPTVGTVSEGATVEKGIPHDLFQSKRIRIVLREPDFTTMDRVVERINGLLQGNVARANDSATVEIPITTDIYQDPITLVSKVEQLEINQDMGAKVIVNERSGTIIMGESVRIGTVALAHGNLSISIRSETQVSQPNALSDNAETAVIQNKEVEVEEDKKRLSLIGGEITLGEVVRALNALGATPRDLISIFTALKRAGALHAELVIM